MPQLETVKGMLKESNSGLLTCGFSIHLLILLLPVNPQHIEYERKLECVLLQIIVPPGSTEMP